MKKEIPGINRDSDKTEEKYLVQLLRLDLIYAIWHSTITLRNIKLRLSSKWIIRRLMKEPLDIRIKSQEWTRHWNRRCTLCTSSQKELNMRKSIINHLCHLISQPFSKEVWDQILYHLLSQKSVFLKWAISQIQKVWKFLEEIIIFLNTMEHMNFQVKILIGLNKSTLVNFKLTLPTFQLLYLIRNRRWKCNKSSIIHQT